MPVTDHRIHQVRDLVDALVTKSLHGLINVLVDLIEDTWYAIIEVDSTLLYEVPLKNVPMDEIFYPIAFNYATIFDEEDRDIYYGSDVFLLNDMKSKYYMYKNIVSTTLPVALDSDLRTNEEFEKLLNLKTDQGLKYFKINGVNSPTEVFMIPMFAGFINLSKPDRIGMSLYDIDGSYLALKMDIFKKKINRDISVYCRIIKL